MRICDGLRFEPVTDTLPPGFAALHEESKAEGHILLTRFVEALASGAERYDGVAGHFLAVTQDGALIALGGIAPDHYLADPSVGRLRHVYVARAHRRSGIGPRSYASFCAAARGFPACACAR
jgi:GNAT superfamily N-acetyltransferase